MLDVINATDARRNWSSVIDSVVRDKPRFIKRTRDHVFLSNAELVLNILSAYTFSAEKYIEDDGSVTLSLNEIDLIDTGADENDARLNMAKQIIEYSEIFYNDFDDWASAPNRFPHIPYVFKALIINDAVKIGEMITCHPGEN
jgi:hypothetical protein